MKAKIFSILAVGLAAALMAAAPNARNNNKKSQNHQANTGRYFCGYYMNYGQGSSSTRGVAPDSAYGNVVNCPYGRGQSVRTGAVPDSSYKNMTGGRYGCGYVMMPMMVNMMRGRMMYGAGDSSFVCPYADYYARPHKQKEGK